MYSFYYIQFSTNIKMYNHIIKTSFVSRAFGNSGLKKLVLILYFFIYSRKVVINTMRKINNFSDYRSQSTIGHSDSDKDRDDDNR